MIKQLKYNLSYNLYGKINYLLQLIFVLFHQIYFDNQFYILQYVQF